MSRKETGKDIEKADEVGETMLPTYGETTEPKDPPSYDSVMAKIKAARADSSNVGTFLLAFITIISGTVCCAFFGFLLLALPIAMIVIGALHLDHCPMEKFIPIYLVVSGAFGSFTNLFSVVNPLRKRCSRKDAAEPDGCCCKVLNGLNGLIGLFLFCWFIAGCVWVYPNYHHVETHITNSTFYCEEVTFYFTFWTLNATFILLGLGFVCCCSACIIFCACAAKAS